MIPGLVLAIHPLRALTAFVTVWCLGCSMFEPILASVTESAAYSTMDCAGDRALRQATDNSGSPQIDGTSVQPAPQRANASADSMNCGCQSCVAPTPVPALASFDLTESVQVSDQYHIRFISVGFKPLLPPPQLDA